MLPDVPDPVEPTVRVFGGIISVLLLSIVAIVLKAVDTADRARTQHPHRHPHRHRHGDGSEPKPWTAAMSATTLDATPIPHLASPAQSAAA